MAMIHPFEALRARLAGEDAPVPDDAPPIARPLRAMDDGSASPLDLAVLIRHALRYERGTLRVPATDGMPSADDWASVGVTATPSGGGFMVEGRPWKPDWLADPGDDGVDAAVAAGQARRRSEEVAGDPFLREFQYETYRSTGQRRALRAALGAPRGSTLVVSLPTGEGKSLVFHALARVGFGDGRGVTLVVTPTVALAADHEQNSQRLGFDDPSLTYRAGDAARNEPLLARIRSGEQLLCFASPEAICTALRAPLREAARNGLLRAIVVDEAHLIDSWGINFRPEFQILAGLRHELLELAGDRQFRTVLLSATLTRDSIAVLQTLFPGDPFRIVSAARLRPEIDFWVAATTNRATREARVLEALHHLPRPLILYTTTRADAAHWFRSLQVKGFRRIGTVTGDTADAERERVVRGWRAGEIDVVVGTSAFGLGIDNPDVRAVVHACIPESLDRFYQEVGRGGRDGKTSLSLLVPSSSDLGVARRLSARQLLTEEVAAHRWRAMFTHETHQFEDGKHVVPVDCRPGVDDREIDMVGPRNTSWNVRTLVLMAAAGGITLVDVPNEFVQHVNSTIDLEGDEDDDDAESERSRVTLAINDPTHLDPAFWGGRIAEFRAFQKAAARRSFDRMTEFLRSGRCAAEIIAPLYEIEADPASAIPAVEVGRACGGCPSCRRSHRPARGIDAPVTPDPWPAVSPATPLLRLIGPAGQLLVFHGQRPTGALARRRQADALRRVAGLGIRNIVLLGRAFEAGDFRRSRQHAPIRRARVGTKRPAGRTHAARGWRPRESPRVPVRGPRARHRAHLAPGRSDPAPLEAGRYAARGAPHGPPSEPRRVSVGVGAMSVVTTMVAVPNRIEAVVDLLRQRSVAEGTLGALLSPSALSSQENVPTNVIGEARRLGLIGVDADDSWTAADAVKANGDTRKLLTRILLDPQLAAAAGQERVALAIAWFLTRDTRTPLPIGDNWRLLVDEDCPGADNAFDLTNPDRCRQFAYWVVYLGFGWLLGSGTNQSREVLVPDPTVAIESVLRTTMSPGDPLPIAEVAARLADACPVLEDGSVRREVERQLTADRRRPAGQLSRSTSFALSRLEERGVITMPPALADARVMTLAIWPEPRRVSHVRLLEGDR